MMVTEKTRECTRKHNWATTRARVLFRYQYREEHRELYEELKKTTTPLPRLSNLHHRATTSLIRKYRREYNVYYHALVKEYEAKNS